MLYWKVRKNEEHYGVEGQTADKFIMLKDEGKVRGQKQCPTPNPPTLPPLTGLNCVHLNPAWLEQERDSAGVEALSLSRSVALRPTHAPV
jgi:hypothetical protein